MTEADIKQSLFFIAQMIEFWGKERMLEIIQKELELYGQSFFLFAVNK